MSRASLLPSIRTGSAANPTLAVVQGDILLSEDGAYQGPMRRARELLLIELLRGKAVVIAAQLARRAARGRV